VNVLINCLSSLSGGATSYLQNALPKLYQLSFSTHEKHKIRFLIHENQKSLLNGVRETDLTVLKGVRPIGFKRILWERQNIRRIVRETASHVLYYPHQIGPLLPDVKRVFMLRNMEPFKFRYYKNTISHTLRNFLLNLLTCRCLRKADRVIAVSKYVEKFAVQNIGINQIRIRQIYHGRDKNFSPEKDSAKDCKILEELEIKSFFVLTPGSLLPYRRCEDVIEAYIRISKQYTGLSLIIAGASIDKGYTRKLIELSKKNGFEKSIKFIGHVSTTTMQTLYRTCSICVISSEIEACPNIAIEAMSSGCLILSCDRQPLPEIFNGSSVQYHSRDISDLKNKMNLCLKGQRIQLSKKKLSLKRSKNFCWNRCASETFIALTEWGATKYV